MEEGREAWRGKMTSSSRAGFGDRWGLRFQVECFPALHAVSHDACEKDCFSTPSPYMFLDSLSYNCLFFGFVFVVVFLDGSNISVPNFQGFIVAGRRGTGCLRV